MIYARDKSVNMTGESTCAESATGLFQRYKQACLKFTEFGSPDSRHSIIVEVFGTDKKDQILEKFTLFPSWRNDMATLSRVQDAHGVTVTLKANVICSEHSLKFKLPPLDYYTSFTITDVPEYAIESVKLETVGGVFKYAPKHVNVFSNQKFTQMPDDLQFDTARIVISLKDEYKRLANGVCVIVNGVYVHPEIYDLLHGVDYSRPTVMGVVN